MNRECQNKQDYTGDCIFGVGFPAGGGEEGGDAVLPVEPSSKPPLSNAMDLEAVVGPGVDETCASGTRQGSLEPAAPGTRLPCHPHPERGRGCCAE